MLGDFSAYIKSNEIWDLTWEDTKILQNDFRGKEIAKQLIRSVGSVSANIEERYSRGSKNEYPHFLRIARGSATESKGWYKKSNQILDKDTVEVRINLLNEIIEILTKTISTLIANSKQK